MNRHGHILVTGAAGFIGSNMLAALEAAGYTCITACDWLGSDGTKWRNVAKRSQVDFISPEVLPEFLASGTQLEAIVHLGAISATTASDADTVMATNYSLPQMLHRYCTGHGVRMIYASSAATYGRGEHGFTDRDDMEYLSALRPLNLYGWSKNAFDMYLSRTGAFGQDAEASVTGLKFFNVYGPNEYHKGSQSSVIPSFYRQVCDSGEISLFRSANPDIADGQQSRDFVSVDDCCAVILWMLSHCEARGIFNVGTGCAATFAEVAKAVSAAADCDASIRFIDMPSDVAQHYQYHTCADITRLRAAGYLTPFTAVREGVYHYIQNYLSHQDTYK